MLKSGTSKGRTCLSVVAGLLVLAGIFSDDRRALAQLQEPCPSSAGVAPVAPPTVTAQEVDNGSATIEEFALAARDRAKEYIDSATTGEEGLYLACILRQNDGIWRSDSAYIVTLTPDGRVFIHAKSMLFSGRLLNPAIYGAILSALGVSSTDLASLASSDPAASHQAFGAVMRTLSQEPDGAFDTTPIPGLRPGIPGASGHAAVYVSRSLGSPILMLAGFDLNESHLAEEPIDYGDPTITAMDVVDRQTLKAFVAEAGNYLHDILATGDITAGTKAKIAMRDPNGPWRHGSVYLYVLDLTNDIVTFHAARPDLLEYKPLVGITRDGRTGELVLPLVLGAAKSSPEGGFVEYYYDDPADDTDDGDIPKVGYARQFEFTGELASGGRVVTLSYLVGSGFYLTSDSEFVQRLLEGLDDGQTSMLFTITTPAPGNAVAGNAVAVSATGASTGTVHFAYRPPDLPEAEFTYLGAATSRAGVAWFAWDTLDLPDGDYELFAMYTEDEGNSVIYDAIEVSVDNAAPAETTDIVEDRGRKTQALQADTLQEVVTADGVVVTLPSGALAEDDRMRIDVAGPPDPATAPGDAVGTGVNISLASGQDMFHEAVTISLLYSQGILDEMDIAEDGLSMWFFDAEKAAWVSLPGSMVQPEADRVVADVTDTGEFAIFDAPVMMAEGGRGDGGCSTVPVLQGGGPLDPTLPSLVALLLAYLVLGRRRPMRQTAVG